MKKFSIIIFALILGFSTAAALLSSCNGGNGNVELTWIKDNAGEKLMPLELFGDVPDSLVSGLSIQEGIPSSVSVFLVKTGEGTILFDTGLGTRESLLEEGLAGAGVKPEDIDFLYLTHFHGDHIGGMMKGDSVAFPNAEVYASQAEYDAWMAMPDGQKAQVVKTMSAYSDRLHLFGFGDVLPGKVLAIGAVGHTPGHTAYQVGTYLIAGDFMHGAALQLAYPEYCAAYDMDKAKAVEARKYLMDYARENGLVLVGMHLPEGIMR